MAKIKCEYKQLQGEAIVVTASNYQSVCDFVNGHKPQKADNPTYPRGSYFGVFIETRYGRQLARIGDYIVRVKEHDYRTYTTDEFNETFKVIDSR